MDKNMSKIDIREEVMEEYMRFMRDVLKRANEENSLKKKVINLLEEFLDDEENRSRITLPGLVNLLREVNKSDNDFVIGVLGAIAKKDNNASPVSVLVNTEKEVSGGSEVKNKEDVVMAKKLLTAFDEMKKTLSESEK